MQPAVKAAENTTSMESWRAELKRSIDQANESDASDDDDLWRILTAPQKPRNRGGSRPGRRANLPRDRVAAHNRIMNDYFINKPLYDADLFRRRFRMR